MNNEKATYIAVVTGDLVDSSKRKGEERKQLDELLKKGLDIVFSDAEDRKDIFRGDSFQIETNPVTVLSKVLKLRSYLKMNGIEARMAIGIGEEDYTAKEVKRSDGEAYQLSGKAFDNLEKNEYLKIVTRWPDFDKILDTLIILLDSHLANHSTLQAEAVYFAIDNMNQLEIAKNLGITQPAINSRLKGANYNAISQAQYFFESEFQILLRNNGYKGILAYHEAKLELQPDNAELHKKYAWLLANEFIDFENAEKHYIKALELNPLDDEAHLLFGIFLEAPVGDIEIAKKHYEKAIEINASNADAHEHLASLLLFLDDDINAAKKHYEEAIKLDRQNINRYEQYAWVLKNLLGDYHESEKYTRIALELKQNKKKGKK
jgi:tetratricopeptide (TPR) repeat protein